ncbi:MAG TPA: hypothetical protein VGV59_20640 [Pyrinomonadaceae bacterium]|nr:hypothetical protein [Pyrinomonadaceae bacterium]
MSELSDWLERLGEKIPGYGGYAERERRRDLDKLHREHLADRLRAAKAPLNETMRELSNSGRLMEIGPLDRALKKLDQIENRVRFASYGYSGFFDVVKIEQPQLEALYGFDLALTQKVEALEHHARELRTQASSADGLKTAAANVEAALDELNRTFDERSRSIDSYRA